MTQTNAYSIYFAGALFNHKDLIGNALVAEFIETESNGSYRCVLPQDLEQATERAVAIRNQDLRQVIECDLAIFNFDGAELDSGTVVEFMLAKFLDIPAVIIRSDFRTAGDQDKDGDNWNLMCSFYPRVGQLSFNGMDWYQHARRRNDTAAETVGRLYSRIAPQLIETLDEVRARPALLAGDIAKAEQLYHWALRFPGGGFESESGNDVEAYVRDIVAGKARKGLI